jgi:GNAT superfamily N-acetyltransferase
MSNAMHWRPMTFLDFPEVCAIADKVHPRFPEHASVLFEKQRLYPDGARLLELDGVASGYLLSHPYPFGQIPPLDVMLVAIPDHADTFYIHDLALLDRARGTGAAAMIVGDILRYARARDLRSMSLLAVNGSGSFWHKHGFRTVDAPDLRDQAAGYEAAARYMSRIV